MNLPEVRRESVKVSGESAGSTKERRALSHCGPPSWGHRECSRFLPGPCFRRFRRGRKGLQLRQQPFGTQSLQAGSRAENFPEVRLLLLSPTTRTLFSLDWILVSPDDFQLQFFKSSNRAVELSEGVRSNNFCAMLVVCFGGMPQGPFGLSQFPVANRLSGLILFTGSNRTRRPSSTGK